ncbi:dynamin family protein [Vibrio cholerae]
METKRKQEILDYLQGLSKHINTAAGFTPELLQKSASILQTSIEEVTTAVAQQVLYVPFVGGFSTGKSTALNTLLERKVLPEKVSPETAIPAELHFSTEEKMMALSQAGAWSEHEISELSMLSANAGNYQLVRLYLNSPVLQQIEPLVMVDMPGFDSGINKHNEAILRYITAGVMYLYLIDCKAGSISRQDLRRIEEILDLGRCVKVFLTKTDLASPQELESARDYVTDCLITLTGESVAGTVNKDNAADMLATINEANKTALFDVMVLPMVKNLFFDADGMVNTAINALNANASDIAQALKEAEQALNNLDADRDRMMQEIKQRGVVQKSDLILSRLEQTLRKATEELLIQARMGETQLRNTIGDLVRSTLSVEIQALLKQTTANIAYQFSGNINISGLALGSNDHNWVEGLISTIESQAMNAIAGLNDSIATDKGNYANKGKSVGNIISLSTIAILIPNPILKVVFAILPGIVGELFGSLRRKTEANQLREAICNQVIPEVLTQLRPQVNESLLCIEAELIRVTSEQVAQKISAQKSLYDEMAKTAGQEASQLEISLSSLKQIRSEMQQNANGVII